MFDTTCTKCPIATLKHENANSTPNRGLKGFWGLMWLQPNACAVQPWSGTLVHSQSQNPLTPFVIFSLCVHLYIHKPCVYTHPELPESKLMRYIQSIYV